MHAIVATSPAYTYPIAIHFQALIRIGDNVSQVITCITIGTLPKITEVNNEGV
jgi:hypothetical protein